MTLLLACLPARAEAPDEVPTPAPPSIEAGASPSPGEAENGRRSSWPAPPTTEAEKARRQELLKQAQNPITTIASSVTLSGYFDLNKNTPGVITALVTIPQNIGAGWNIIHRGAMSVQYTPISLFTAPGGRSPSAPELGLGDANYTPLFAPPAHGRFVWAIGPSVTLPTATGPLLGSGRLLAGASIAAVTMQKRVVAGVIVNNQWSVTSTPGKAAVSVASVAPFINYNLSRGWYLLSTPKLLVNWNSRQDPKWVIPVGGGIGRFFPLGGHAANMSLQAFYHLERPTGGRLWSLNLQFQYFFGAKKLPEN